ncbi:MAG: universal stress protein [Myxococcota bacterium]
MNGAVASATMQPMEDEAVSPIPKRILVAYDFSGPARRALSLARDLQAAHDAAVDVVHVVHDPYEGLEHPPRESVWVNEMETERYLDSLRERMEADVEGTFGQAKASVKVHVVRGDIDDGVLKLREQTGADLVVVGTTGKGAVDRFLLGSVSTRLLHRSNVPVLTVP